MAKVEDKKCCLIVDGKRCNSLAGLATFTKRIKFRCFDKNLQFATDPYVNHGKICEDHKFQIIEQLGMVPPEGTISDDDSVESRLIGTPEYRVKIGSPIASAVDRPPMIHETHHKPANVEKPIVIILDDDSTPLVNHESQSNESGLDENQPVPQEEDKPLQFEHSPNYLLMPPPPPASASASLNNNQPAKQTSVIATVGNPSAKLHRPVRVSSSSTVLNQVSMKEGGLLTIHTFGNQLTRSKRSNSFTEQVPRTSKRNAGKPVANLQKESPAKIRRVIIDDQKPSTSRQQARKPTNVSVNSTGIVKIAKKKVKDTFIPPSFGQLTEDSLLHSTPISGSRVKKRGKSRKRRNTDDTESGDEIPGPDIDLTVLSPDFFKRYKRRFKLIAIGRSQPALRKRVYDHLMTVNVNVKELIPLFIYMVKTRSNYLDDDSINFSPPPYCDSGPSSPESMNSKTTNLSRGKSSSKSKTSSTRTPKSKQKSKSKPS